MHGYLEDETPDVTPEKAEKKVRAEAMTSAMMAECFGVLSDDERQYLADGALAMFAALKAPVAVAVDVNGVFVGLTALLHEVEDDEEEDHHDQHAQPHPTGVVLYARQGRAGEVTEQREGDAPDDGAGGVGDEESTVVHPTHPGQTRHHGAQERREAPDEDIDRSTSTPVSYTHLDVYKRQVPRWGVQRSVARDAIDECELLHPVGAG